MFTLVYMVLRNDLYGCFFPREIYPCLLVLHFLMIIWSLKFTCITYHTYTHTHTLTHSHTHTHLHTLIHTHTHTHTHTTHTLTHTHTHSRQSSSSSTTSASSEERDDVTTTLNTSGCVSPLHSPRTATRSQPVGRGSNSSSTVITGTDPKSSSTEVLPLNLDNDLVLGNICNYPFLIPPNISMSSSGQQLLLPSSTSAQSLRLNAPSANPALQVIAAPQSSNTGSSLSPSSRSNSPSSEAATAAAVSSSGQPVSVITSYPASLPIPPYQPLHSSSELNSDPFLPYCELSSRGHL